MTMQLNLSTLEHLDGGKIMRQVNHAIRQAVADVIDRPGNGNDRKVVLELSFAPSLDGEHAALDTVGLVGRIRVKIPDAQTVQYPMLPRADGTLGFSPSSPQDPRQGSLYETPDGVHVDPDTGEVVG